jgi:hypothetical protein
MNSFQLPIERALLVFLSEIKVTVVGDGDNNNVSKFCVNQRAGGGRLNAEASYCGGFGPAGLESGGWGGKLGVNGANGLGESIIA